jgi:hypothetical protein
VESVPRSKNVCVCVCAGGRGGLGFLQRYKKQLRYRLATVDEMGLYKCRDDMSGFER